MGVPASFDREVRDDLRVLLQDARGRLQLTDEWDGDAWLPAAASTAAKAVLLTELPFDMSPIHSGGLDLALTIARSFLTEAADGLVVAGQLQTLEAGQRIASFGPVVRTSAEKSAAVYWMFDADNSEQRLARAVLLDCDGLEWQIRYLQRSGHEDLAERLRHEHELLIRSANQAMGRRAVKTGSGQRVVRVANETLPTKTEMFEKALSGENSGRAAYSELSVYAHPTGHRQSFGASTWSYQETQVVYEPTLRVHDEGRLLEPCLLAFANAGIAVGDYVGLDLRGGMTSLLQGAADAWGRWCRRNGCPPVSLTRSRF